MTSTSRWGETEPFDPEHFKAEMQKMMDRLKGTEPKVITIPVTNDFSQLELYMLAAMAHESVGGIVLDMDRHGGMIDTSNRHFFPYEAAKTFEPKTPAVKQNGRSAAYLKHDRTKRHGR